MKIGITGSQRWENRIVIKDLIYKLKYKYKNNLEILSGGTIEGVDKYVKKYALEFDIEFIEVKPYNYSYNHYCLRPSYYYDKPYKPNYFYIRNSDFVRESDIIILFVKNNETGNVLKDIINQCEKKSKKIIIINE